MTSRKTPWAAMAAMSAATAGSPRPLTVMMTTRWPATAFSTSARSRPSPSTTAASRGNAGQGAAPAGECGHLVATPHCLIEDEPPVTAGRSEHRDLHVPASASQIIRNQFASA